MKPNLFNHTLLAVGVAAALGLSTTAMAATEATSGDKTNSIKNQATATYKVADQLQDKAVSNEVIVNIDEVAKFSLIGKTVTPTDNDQTDEKNEDVIAKPNSTATYTHELTNSGNLTDSYSMDLSGLAPNGNASDLANISVTYETLDTDGSLKELTVSGVDFKNVTIELAPGQTSTITINEGTTGYKGGQTSSLTISAQSTYITTSNDASTATVENFDNLLVKLPVFSINKTVTNPLDLNNTDDIATYSITVKNDNTNGYADKATNITVRDNLPAGLKLVSGSVVATIGSNTLATTGLTEGTDGDGSGTAKDSFEYSGIDLEVGETVTITFNVMQDTSTGETLADGTVNHARVEDDINDDPNTVIDSTDPNDPDENVDDYYPTGGDGSDSAESLTTVKRGLELTGTGSQEVPTVSNDTTKATYEAVIENTGEEVEGKNTDDLKIQITDGTNNEVNPANNLTIIYDVDGDLTTTGDQTSINVPYDSAGEYDIGAALAGDNIVGMAPGSKVIVQYDVVSITESVLDSQETTTVTLIPAGANTNGDGAIPEPTDPTKNWTKDFVTTVKGVDLQKYQAIDAGCSGDLANYETAFNFTQYPLNKAKPDQCVVYKIDAKNTFSGPTDFNITELVISDALSEFQNNATVDAILVNTPTTGSGTSASNTINDGNAITTTVNPLVPQGTATMVFRIKIKANASTTTP
ncbi:hypothetical protein [Psychrobacter celer]|uniref:hypothetical protein n=1 Tax=Psychrobacter celer TaxID=306572 RepID=UPI003FD4D316